MGYMINDKNFSIFSDNTLDFACEISEAIVCKLQRHEKCKETSPYNTDGIVDVAICLNELFNRNLILSGDIEDYIQEFIPRFASYVKIIKKRQEWGSKTKHMKAFKKILKGLRNKMYQINKPN